MKSIFDLHENPVASQEKIIGLTKKFHEAGSMVSDGKRNKVKFYSLEGSLINIKSYKIPHCTNKISYKYFRKSKAHRSFNYAKKLLAMGVETPKPIAYMENHNALGLEDSYYVSEHLKTELTFREIERNINYPDHENILRQFAQFSFGLHEKGIEFLDHSPGNTLIKKLSDGKYSFCLVDLNRMKFHRFMGFVLRMKNLTRLTENREMISIISNEYAKFYNKTEVEIFDKLWFETRKFRKRIARKNWLKRKLKIVS
jgi:hypothetical protein